MQELRVPLVSVVRTEGDEKHTKIEYYTTSGGILLLDMEILKEYVPSSGPLDELTLVQLLVTPHEHMAVLADIVALARAGKTAGPEWDSVLSRVENLLSPPAR